MLSLPHKISYLSGAQTHASIGFSARYAWPEFILLFINYHYVVSLLVFVLWKHVAYCTMQSDIPGFYILHPKHVSFVCQQARWALYPLHLLNNKTQSLGGNSMITDRRNSLLLCFNRRKIPVSWNVCHHSFKIKKKVQLISVITMYVNFYLFHLWYKYCCFHEN